MKSGGNVATEKFVDYKVDTDKLIDFGFAKQGKTYKYQQLIVEGQFQLAINIDEKGILTTKVLDTENKAEYILHLQPNATGKFVSKVRHDYQAVLDDIKLHCYENNVFQTPQAQRVIEFVRDTYDDQLEFLWKKFPKNAIWRRSDTNKWYAALLTVAKSKLGLDSDDIVTVIDLREKPEIVEKLVDGKKCLPGYHMNKKNWYTIILDGTVSDTEIIERIKASYGLATK